MQICNLSDIVTTTTPALSVPRKFRNFRKIAYCAYKGALPFKAEVKNLDHPPYSYTDRTSKEILENWARISARVLVNADYGKGPRHFEPDNTKVDIVLYNDGMLVLIA